MSSNACEHVSRRVQKSKKEIEQLKQELEKLIHRGVDTQIDPEEDSEPLKTLQNEDKHERTEKMQMTFQPLLTSARTSSLRNVTLRTNFPTQQTDTKQHESPKKVRHYNVEEAREYMRKQKEKRLNKIKTEVKDSQNTAELRKEKLRDLQKRSLELVQKNINLKRERSRSRDRGKLEYDKKENIDNQKIDKFKDNKLHENRSKSKDKIINTQNKRNENVKEQTTNDNLPLNKNSVPDLIVNNFIQIDSNIPHSPPQKNILNREDAAIKIQRFYRKYRQKTMKQVPHQDLITMFRNVPFESKTTQNRFDVPVWLTPKVESYPYNFINTVKRKLNFAINKQNQNKDAATQIDSFDASKIKEDLKRSLDESKRKESIDNGLFLNQKYLDLDLGKVEMLKLLDKKDCDKKHSFSDSESDTSKNIPDISTENSIKSLSDIKTSSNSKLLINIDTIKDLKLEDQHKKSHDLNFIEKFCSRSTEHITKRPKETKKSRSTSSITNLKKSNVDPSPLQVPNINLIASEPPSENTNNDLRSFLEFMSNLDYKKHSKSRTDSFVSLPHSSTKSDSVKTELSAKNARKSDSYSSCFCGSTSSVSSVPSLKRPTVMLSTSQNEENGKSDIINNKVSIKPGEVKHIETKCNTNQIHLKFEAELHLLNDFNESLRQFMAVEKTILDLHSKNQNSSIVLQNQDTQTSAQLEEQLSNLEDSVVSTAVDEESISESRGVVVPSVNYSRGSDVCDDFNKHIKNDMGSTRLKKERSLVSVSLDLSQLDNTVNSTVDESISNVSVKTNESYSKNVFAGFSVGMFDQLIRDEDTRIENLKTILKIREKALLDRTKGELAWLEIQKKQLIETGQLHEASLLKKKQRGILIKLQHEKQEMQRLKQIQKQASKERKTVLKEQRNMIKAQLSNNYTIPKIKRSVHKERRQSGPVKVYNLHRETINTETSISRRNSVAEEIIITSRSESVVGQITEDYSADQDSVLNSSARSFLGKGTEDAKKSLLMREAALQKRKKAAEDLLQWHQRLLEEERKIAELEMAANTIIKQAPSIVNNQEASDDHHKFKGSQLNLLWLNMTGRNEKKFHETEYYALSPIALEKFCKEAKKAATKSDKVKQTSDRSITSEDSVETKYSKKSTEVSLSFKSDKKEILETNESSYTPDFESHIMEVSTNESIPKKENNTGILQNEIDRSKSTFNEIMQNISNITDEISAIYKLSTAANINEPSATNESTRTSEVSVRTQTKPISVVNSASILSDNQIQTESELEHQNPCDESLNKQLKIDSESNTLRNIDDQINEILTEGTKRINNILNSRTQTLSKEILSDKCEALSENNIRTDKSTDITDKIASEIFSNKVDIHNINEIKSNIKQNNSISDDVPMEKNSSNEILSDIIADSENVKSSGTVTKQSPEIPESLKSKSISITVLKSQESPKSNSLSSNVTLVKNLTELIKTGTESVCTPDSKNTHTDSPGTLSCNGGLLSTSNELKIETNDGGRSTSHSLCQIADIFSNYKELATEDTNLETEGFGSELYPEYDKTQSTMEDIEINAKSFENTESGNNNEVSRKSKLKLFNELNKSIAETSNSNKGDNRLEDASKNDSSINIHTESNLIAEISTKLNKENKTLQSEVTLNGVVETPFKSTSENISTIKTKETTLSNHIKSKNMLDLNEKLLILQRNEKFDDKYKSEKSIKKSDDSITIVPQKDKSTTLSNISSIKDDSSLRSHSNHEQTSQKIIFKPLTTLEQSSPKSSITNELNKISNYATHNGHGAKWDEEINNLQNKFQALTIENQNVSLSKTITEHSNKNDTLETTNDVDSILSENKENTINSSSGDKITYEDKSKTTSPTNIPEEVSTKAAIEDETNASISITELSQGEEFEDNKDSNDHKTTLASADSTSPSKSERLSAKTEVKLSEKSEIKSVENGDLNSRLSELKPLESNDIKSVGTSIFKSEAKSEIKPLKGNESKPVGKTVTKSDHNSECKESSESKSKSYGEATDFVDVKKRVSEILADANSPRGDRSPRLQDIYTTTYDILSPDRSPEMGSPVSNEKDLASVTQMFGEEAEALFKKQLAIEQEIKQLEQQQKEQIPYMYMREIPNKPPPPYTPPVAQSQTSSTVPASAEQLDVIVCNVARILHNSYYKGTLETAVLTDRDKRTFSLRHSNIDKECYEYIFDLCRGVAIEHYQQFVDKPKPSWLRISKKHMARRKPFNELELRQHLFKEIKVLLGYEKDLLKESVISKWCRKKRDHVDEILIVESQAEESEWTNYDEDEVMVKDELTSDIMKMLIVETAQVLTTIMQKRVTESPS